MFGLNNGIANTVRAMPRKDSTSDNTSSFAASRRTYSALNFTTVTNDERLMKKWHGAVNRDASSVTVVNRVYEVGIGSLNAESVPMSFKSSFDTNTRRQAIGRVRHNNSMF
jgi:hypothetical protein